LPELHRRAAAWYAANDLISEAIQHSFAAKDIDLAGDLIQAQAKNLLGRGEITTLLRWIEALSEPVIKSRPQLGLARAWGMLMREPLRFLETIDQQINQIAEGFGIDAKDLLGALSESEPDSQLRAGLAEFAMLQAFARRDSTREDGTIELSKPPINICQRVSCYCAVLPWRVWHRPMPG
jgi:ATP/maltotriose-dependent transcriptional regulator MalT